MGMRPRILPDLNKLSVDNIRFCQSIANDITSRDDDTLRELTSVSLGRCVCSEAYRLREYHNRYQDLARSGRYLVGDTGISLSLSWEMTPQ
jgi:hypothetical protein